MRRHQAFAQDPVLVRIKKMRNNAVEDSCVWVSLKRMGGGGDEAPTFFYCNETEEMGADGEIRIIGMTFRVSSGFNSPPPRTAPHDGRGTTEQTTYIPVASSMSYLGQLMSTGKHSPRLINVPSCYGGSLDGDRGFRRYRVP